MAAPRRLPPLPSTRDVLRLYGIRAKKSLSQNFILDPRTLDKFARSAKVEGKTVIEVGPGPGGITRALLGRGAKAVHVIEKDPRFIPSLQLLQEASGCRVFINQGDCLKYNVSKLFPEDLRQDWNAKELPDLVYLGNLPFNVSTPLLMRLIRDMQLRQNLFTYGRVPLHFTFQKELAERLIAPPGSRNRSRISILCQNYAQVSLRYSLPGGAFVPPPKVDVSVVSLVPLRKPYIDLPFHFMERVITSVFFTKAKWLRNAIEILFPLRIRPKMADELLHVAKIPPEKPPYELTMEELEKLCFTYKQMTEEYPRITNYIHESIRPLLLDNVIQAHLKLDSGEEKPLEIDDELNL